MRAQTYASNKTEAAKLAGMSRTTLYALMRLPNFPAPRADGRWCIPAIRKFALKSAKKLEGPLERDNLQLELTRLKIKKASQELVEFEQEIRAGIEGEIREHFERAINTLAGRLKMLPRDLASRCEGMSAQQVFKFATDLLYAAFDKARQDFLNHVPEKPEQSTNVLPFRTRVETNGAELVSTSIRK